MNEHVVYDAARARAGRIRALILLDHNAGTVVPLCDEIIRLFGTTDDPNIKPYVAHAFHQKADFLREDQHEERIPVMESLLDLFASQEPHPELAEDVLRGAYKCAWDLDRLNRPAEAIHVIQEVMPWMEPSTDPRLRELQEEMADFSRYLVRRAQAALDAEPSTGTEPGV